MTSPANSGAITISPELQLVTACSWLAAPGAEYLQAERIAHLVTQPLNWEEVIALADYHNVQALVFETLGRYANALPVPENARGLLKSRKIAIAARSLQQTHELLRVTTLFDDLRLRAIPLKGVALSIQLYDNPAIRNSVDLDIMVRPEDLESACRLLETSGYAGELHGVALTGKQRNYIRNNLYHLEFRHTESGIPLELHWKPGALWTGSHVEELWNRSSSTSWQGHNMCCLDDDDLLLFLCDHAARHRFYSLKWLGDIARLLSTERPQGIGTLVERAVSLDLVRPLSIAVILVHRLYGLQVPDLLNRAENDRMARACATRILQLLVESSSEKAPLARRLGGIRLAWDIMSLRTDTTALRAFKPQLVAPADFHEIPLPDQLFWLYYPLRPCSWLWRYLRKK